MRTIDKRNYNLASVTSIRFEWTLEDVSQIIFGLAKIPGDVVEDWKIMSSKSSLALSRYLIGSIVQPPKNDDQDHDDKPDKREL